MARLARWAIGGLAHHVLLPAHNQRPVITDDADRVLFLEALRAASEAHGVVVHAAALPDAGAHLLLRPHDDIGLSGAIQALGRRFVAAYNLRHRRTGTPWNGRFRAAPLQPGAPTLLALTVIASLAQEAEPSRPTRWSPESAWWVDPPELWALGNTPFERELAYHALLQRGASAAERERLLAHVRRGLPMGDPAFLAGLAASRARPTEARPRGRPATTTRHG